MAVNMSAKLQTSNITNKNDPRSINSRVFIGNLNTAVVKKSDVETIFGQYGKVVGCSVHKGYAFVQYTNERTARVAVAGENRRVLAGQTLDINMAGEPKPNRPKGLKQPSSSLFSSSYEFDYDYFRDDFYERMHEYSSRPSLIPRAIPVKRSRVIIPVLRRGKSGIPLKLMARSTTVTKNSAKLKLKSNELHRIKVELTQIKSNIDSLLGRLEEIARDKVGHTEPRKKADEVRTELSHTDSASETADAVTEEPLGEEGDCDELEQGEAMEDNECEDEMESNHRVATEGTLE
ncbi:RNA-binding protein Raly isoform X2 [Scyliorhinus canicula]|uniref:RNA-binding protein Raly isoform X2 n=1 Tax=Scyliorhinus canicula TaxID=7830 RepID=UPI0018F37704|nr:RNA-binding protein Raly isoform X2 [Scyliorhinus canicula]